MIKKRLLKYLSQDIEESVNDGNDATGSSLFNSHLWYKNFDQFICFNDKLTRYLISETNEQICKLPLKIEKSTRVFGLLSSLKLKALSNYYTPYFGLFSLSQLDNSADIHDQHISAFQRYLKCFNRIELNPLVESEMLAFKKAFKKQGYFVSTYVCSTNWYEDNIKDVDDYWSRRRSKLKNTIRRRRDKVNKSGQYEFVVQSEGNLLRSLADFHHVYYHSWKVNEPFPAFIDQLAQDMMDAGKLRMGVVYQDKRPLAAQMWFVENGIAYIFKLAHCPEAEKHSLGSVLTAEMFNYVIEKDKVTKVDFLTGNDNYKKDWMSKSRPLYKLTAYNTKTFLGLGGALKSYLDKDQSH